jgi:CRP-like cAMP-binding protein
MKLSSAGFKNRILASLSGAEAERVVARLKPINLPQRTPLINGDRRYAYFLESGVASFVVTVDDGHSVEVGIVGNEGVVGTSLLGGGESVVGRTFIQIKGYGYQMSAKALQEEFEEGGEFRRRVQGFMQGFMIQVAQTAACNRLHNIEERLARWLLSCRDRTKDAHLPLTQEFLGQMLGAPRTTVTLSAGLLQRGGMIQYTRGAVTILDQPALENAACECYAIVRDEYRRLKLF